MHCCSMQPKKEKPKKVVEKITQAQRLRQAELTEIENRRSLAKLMAAEEKKKKVTKKVKKMREPYIRVRHTLKGKVVCFVGAPHDVAAAFQPERRTEFCTFLPPPSPHFSVCCSAGRAKYCAHPYSAHTEVVSLFSALFLLFSVASPQIS